MSQFHLVGWTTSLPQRINAGRVTGLYAEHGTYEQFHSEFKSDMNLLRLIGRHTLHSKDAPVRHPAPENSDAGDDLQGRPHHPSRRALGLGANDAGLAAFERHYRCMASG